MTQPKWKAQHWRGSIDGEVGKWVDVRGAVFDSEAQARAWEMENQEDYARTGTRVVSCEHGGGE